MTRGWGAARRVVRQFGRFVWDFFVGDTPELFVGTLIVLGVVAILTDFVHDNLAGWVVFPPLVVATLFASTYHAYRSTMKIN